MLPITLASEETRLLVLLLLLFMVHGTFLLHLSLTVLILSLLTYS